MSKPWCAVLAIFLLGSACSLSLLVSACTSGDLTATPAPGSSSGSAGQGDPTPDTADAGVPGRPGASAIIVPTSSNVSIQIEPSDLGAQVEASIRAARSSVHMTMYLLTNTSIIDALGDLEDAGKDVKVVLNKTFPADGGDNGPAFAKLQARHVPVVYAPSAYTFTHAKTVVIDASSLLVMTMNLTQTSARDNRELIATDGDPADVADAEKLFAADFVGASVSLTGKMIVSPQLAQPQDPRARLKALMDSATTSLDVEVQSLSDTVLTDAIVAAHRANVRVRVVLSGEPGQTTSELAAIQTLKSAGVPLKGVLDPYIHAKAVVVDGAVVFVGSQNFTPTALLANREVGVVTDAATEVKKVEDVIAADFQSGTGF